MNRRAFVTGVGAVLAAPLGPAEAQQMVKSRRIGFLGTTRDPRATWMDAFRAALSELGWREGDNLTIEARNAEGHLDRLPALAVELVRLHVELIVAGSTVAALAAKRATDTIPIVITAVSDPVAAGLVTSLARPGGNVTGVALLAGFETVGKYLELLKQVVPRASRIAFLSNPDNVVHLPMVRHAETACRSMACEIRPVEARTPAEFDGAFAAMRRQRVDALLVVGDPIFLVERAHLATLALNNRLPSMYGLQQHAEAGGLMAYAANWDRQYRHAARFVDRILRGANPADLPIEQPTKFDLVINLKTAKALGLTIPPSLLLRADQVIE